MKQTNQMEETLFSSTHIHLDKRVSVKQILFSLLIALCGVISIVFSLAQGKSDSTLSMALLSIGVILILFALYRFFTKSHEVIYRPTGSEVRSGTLYMEMTELQSLKDMMTKNDFPASFRLAFKQGGNGRLDYLVSKDGRFVAAQLLQFVPYTYEAVTGVCYYTDDDAVAVSRLMHI